MSARAAGGYVRRRVERHGGLAASRRAPGGGITNGSDARKTDPLSYLLAGLRLRCVLGGGLTMTAPWSLRSAGDLPAGFYVIISGRCWLTAPALPSAVRLGPGDVIFVARNLEHRLGHDPHLSARRPGRLLRPADIEEGRRLAFGGGGTATRLIRGNVLFPGNSGGPLFSSLPPVVHLRRGGEPSAPWLAAAFDALVEGRNRETSGTQRMTDLLAEAVLTQLVRTCLRSAPPADGHPLGAMVDPVVGPVLETMHLRPGEPWTVATLAREAGLSRSLFAARFAFAVGVPPMRYVQECRMQSASTMLRDGLDCLKEIARQAGYSSEPAFSNAFKRWSGRPPGVYRDEMTATEHACPVADGRTGDSPKRGLRPACRLRR